MIEKVKELDFEKMSEEESDVLLEELMNQSDEDLKESLNNIIDTIDYKYTSEEESDLFPSYNKIFGNERIKEMLSVLLKEYEETE